MTIVDRIRIEPPIINRCINPGCTTDPAKARFKRCADCHTAIYCSAPCQKANWANHKIECYKKIALSAKNQFYCPDEALLKLVNEGQLTIEKARKAFKDNLVKESIKYLENPQPEERLKLHLQMKAIEEISLESAKTYDKYAKLSGLPKLNLTSHHFKTFEISHQFVERVGLDFMYDLLKDEKKQRQL